MFLAFTPNPCLEKTISIPDFALHQTHRVFTGAARLTAGGKGINAARVAARFGATTRVLAPVGRFERAFFESHLTQDGLEPLLIETPLSTRLCLNIISRDSAQNATEILEAGEAPSLEIGTQLLEIWQGQMASAKLALIGGSYPHSNEAAWLSHAAILSHLARAANVPLIYDGKGEAFRRAVFSKSPPWAIKPNLIEAQELLNRELSTAEQQKQAIRDVMKRGVEVVLLSLGEKGCWLGWRGQIEWLQAPKIQAVSPVGSGDSLVGAFAAKLLETSDVFEAARWGVAAGAANAAQFEAAQIGPRDCQPLLSQVKVKISEFKIQTSRF